MRGQYKAWNWRPFVENDWQKRPRVFKGPYAPKLQSKTAFTSLLDLNDRLRNNDQRICYRIYLEGWQLKTVAEEYWAKSSDGSIQGYIDRLSQQWNGAEISIVINQFDSVCAKLEANLGPFFSGLYDLVGRPLESMRTDIFFGNYSVSPLKLHKDKQEVFSFVLEGEKRYYLWPYETFADHPSCATDPFGTLPIDYTHYLDEAIVLKAKRGDIVYIPRGFWHVADHSANYTFNLAPGLYYEKADPRSASHFFASDSEMIPKAIR